MCLYLNVYSFARHALIVVYCYIIAVTTNPQNTTTAVGTIVSLICSASGVDDVMYQWMRKGNRVIPSQARGVNTNRLVINSIQPDDSGEYRCTASSGGVDVNSEYGTVSVLGKLIIESSVRYCYRGVYVCCSSSSHHYTS